MEGFVQNYGDNTIYQRTYHPQSQSKVVNRVLQQFLICHVIDQPTKWTKYEVPSFGWIMVINLRIHKSDSVGNIWKIVATTGQECGNDTRICRRTKLLQRRIRNARSHKIQSGESKIKDDKHQITLNLIMLMFTRR